MYDYRSRSTDEENDASNDNMGIYSDEDQNLADLIEDNESGDSETATEVEVSEKTLKFKISTEGNISANSISGRKSYPGSRKGSREKSQQLTCSEVARAVQREKERGKFTSALSFDSRSKRLSMDMNESIAMLRKYDGRSFDRGRLSIGSPSSGKSVDFLMEENDECPRKPGFLSEENGNVKMKGMISPKIEISEPSQTVVSDNHLINNNKESSERTINNLVSPVNNLDEISVVNAKTIEPEYVVVPASLVEASSSKVNHRSILARIRQYTVDKFSLNLDSKHGSGTQLHKSPGHEEPLTNCCSKSMAEG